MEFLIDLWLPIILSAVFVFLASTALHMVVQIHKNDAGQLPDEDGLAAAMRANPPTPGEYYMPYCASMKELDSEEMKRKYREGPIAWIAVLPPGTNGMARGLVLWFVYSLIVSIFVAYIAHLALDIAEYSRVFRVTGAIAVSIYGLSSIPNSVWKGVPWSTTFKFFLDGVVYGLVTAGTFGWLWPSS